MPNGGHVFSEIPPWKAFLANFAILYYTETLQSLGTLANSVDLWFFWRTFTRTQEGGILNILGRKIQIKPWSHWWNLELWNDVVADVPYLHLVGIQRKNVWYPAPYAFVIFWNLSVVVKCNWNKVSNPVLENKNSSFTIWT